MDDLLQLLNVRSATEFWWVMIGLLGQILFAMRFIIQWLASERARRSVVPLAFWYFSIAGGVILLAYAIYRRDPVFIFGQSMGLFVYARNLWLIRNAERANPL